MSKDSKLARVNVTFPQAEWERNRRRARQWAKEHGVSVSHCFSPYIRAALEFFHKHRPKE